MNWRVGCLIAFVVIIGAPVLASRYLPWWGTLLFIAAEGASLLWGIPRLIRFGARRFATGLFTAKSRVLRGAMVQIHRVELQEGPEPAQAVGLIEDQSEDGPVSAVKRSDRAMPIGQRFVLIEFTITSRKGASRMQFYEPDELMLIAFNSKIDISSDPTSDDTAGVIRKCVIVDENGVETEDFDKVTGPNRLRTIFRCPPTLVGRAKFRYYFEQFGDVMLP